MNFTKQEAEIVFQSVLRYKESQIQDQYVQTNCREILTKLGEYINTQRKEQKT